MSEPDTIDMMDEHELRTELRATLSRLSANLKREADLSDQRDNAMRDAFQKGCRLGDALDALEAALYDLGELGKEVSDDPDHVLAVSAIADRVTDKLESLRAVERQESKS